MSQSSLVDYRDYSAKHWNDRKGSGIKRIVIHHCASVLTVEQLGRIFRSKQASSTYGIGNDGRVGQYVPEEYRPWTTSGWEPDRNCITIEVSNSAVEGNWPVSDKVLGVLIDLVTDICRRNGLTINYTGDKRGNLLMHKWYASTACPGPYLASKFPYIAAEVNKRLRAGTSKQASKSAASSSLYRVQIGAFSSKANADKLLAQAKEKGFDAIITDDQSSGSAAQTDPSIAVGSRVKLKAGAKTYTGGRLSPYTYNRVYTVSQLNGKRAVISYGKTVIAAVSSDDLVCV